MNDSNWFRQVFCFLPLALLVACAGDSKPTRADPPQASIGELRLADNGELILDLHLQNVSEVSITAERLLVTLTTDGQIQRFAKYGAIGLPMLGGERILLRAEAAPGWLDRLSNLDRAEELAFQLDGELVQVNGRVLKIDYDGRLSSTPGRPNSFR